VTAFIVPWIELLCAYTGRSSTGNTPNSVLFTLFIILQCHKSKAYCPKDGTIYHLIRLVISPTVLFTGLDRYPALTACRSPQRATNFFTDPRTNRLSNVPHHLVRNSTWREIFSIFYDSVIGQRDSMGRKMAVFQSLTTPSGIRLPSCQGNTKSVRTSSSYAVGNRVAITKLVV
jgi:hypothetical protein